MLKHSQCIPADIPSLFAFLERTVETSVFLLENLRTQGITDQSPLFVVARAPSRDGESIVGAASVNAGGILLIQSSLDTAALAAFALTRSDTPLRGILGPSAQVSSVLDGLHLRDVPARMHSDERLYTLDLTTFVSPVTDPALHVRLAQRTDIERLTTFRRAYHIEALGAKDDAELDAPARADAERMCRDGVSFVLVDGNEIVAMTTFTARHEHVVQVGGVFTSANLRRKHYGRIVVAGSLDHAAREWKAERAVLFTAENNFAAQRAYEGLGFTRNGRYTLHFFRQPITPSELRNLTP